MTFELIEELLGITELSKAEALKEAIKETKDEIKDEEYNPKAKEDVNSRILKVSQILNVDNVSERKHDTKLQELQSGFDSLSHVDIKQEIANHQTLKEYNEKKSKLDETNRWIDSINADNKKPSDLETRVRSDIEIKDPNALLVDKISR